MKIRIDVTEVYVRRGKPETMVFIDDILLWSMESEIDAEFYAFAVERDSEAPRWGRPKSMGSVQHRN